KSAGLWPQCFASSPYSPCSHARRFVLATPASAQGVIQTMKRLVLVGALALGALACEPSIPRETPPSVIIAQFDPAASPAVVPTPNDLAMGTNGKLSVPVPPGASAADVDFIAFLNTLDGYPANSTASVTFSG